MMTNRYSVTALFFTLICAVGCGDGSSLSIPHGAYIAGSLSSYRDETLPANTVLIRVLEDGTRDTTFNVTANGNVAFIGSTEDGSGDLWIAGGFTLINGSPLHYIARLNIDGSIDSSFVSLVPNSSIAVVTPVGDGSEDIYVGGQFTQYNGIGAPKIMRLNKNGTRDLTFSPASGFTALASVTSIRRVNDGTNDIYIGGSFSTYNAVTTNNIVRVTQSGAINGTFAVTGAGDGFNAGTTDLLVPSDGSRVYASGYFTTFNGTNNRNHILALGATGNPEASFDIGPGAVATSGLDDWATTMDFARDSTGDILVGGNFSSYRSTAVNRIVRLTPTGVVSPSFNSGTGFDNDVRDVCSGYNGDVYVVGDFSSYNGGILRGVARLDASTGALQAGFENGFAPGDIPTGVLAF